MAIRFSEDLFETSLYNDQDVVSSIGGIYATINASAVLLVMIGIANYVYTLAQVMQRKAKYRLG